MQKISEEPTIVLTVRVPKSWATRLNTLAREYRITQAQAHRQALKRYTHPLTPEYRKNGRSK